MNLFEKERRCSQYDNSSLTRIANGSAAQVTDYTTWEYLILYKQYLLLLISAFKV